MLTEDGAKGGDGLNVFLWVQHVCIWEAKQGRKRKTKRAPIRWGNGIYKEKIAVYGTTELTNVNASNT